MRQCQRETGDGGGIAKEKEWKKRERRKEGDMRSERNREGELSVEGLLMLMFSLLVRWLRERDDEPG